MSAVMELKTTNAVFCGKLFDVGLDISAIKCGKVKQL
jgi:hypothetical protein